jgi:hypothetical protein
MLEYEEERTDVLSLQEQVDKLIIKVHMMSLALCKLEESVAKLKRQSNVVFCTVL